MKIISARLTMAFVVLSANFCLSSQTVEARGSAVTDVLHMQAEAWNRGDLDKFLTGYARKVTTSYVTSDAEVYGYKALKDRYLKRYGSSRETMGNLSFTDLNVRKLGARDALCVGHWHLTRADKPELKGIFSLMLERSRGGWLIIHDHTSLQP